MAYSGWPPETPGAPRSLKPPMSSQMFRWPVTSCSILSSRRTVLSCAVASEENFGTNDGTKPTLHLPWRVMFLPACPLHLSRSASMPPQRSRWPNPVLGEPVRCAACVNERTNSFPALLLTAA
jgi:hypothetical protein